MSFNKESQIKFRIICYPRGWMTYHELFAKSMLNYGIAIEPGIEFNDSILFDEKLNFDGINFQFVEYFWKSSSVITSMHRILGLKKFYSLALRKGKRIIWTFHEHCGHESSWLIDYIGFRSIAQSADLIIVHSRWSENYLNKMFRPKGSIVYMPIGNYDGFYNPSRSSIEVKSAYGLDQNIPLCGIIGDIRSSRGIELAIKTASKMKGEIQLIVAGRSKDFPFRRKVDILQNKIPNVFFYPGWLSHTEYADLIKACDLILLPYTKVTGSAALQAVWTLGRAVILSKLPYFREFKPDSEAAGIILESYTEECLTNCIRKILSVPKTQREQSSRYEAEKYGWDEIVQPVADTVLEWI